MNYFITFRTYGTWLHGDKRGSVDRFHTQVNEPLIAPDARLQGHRKNLMKSEAVALDDFARECVADAIREVASHRGWSLLALNVLSNHLHALVTVPDDVQPEKVMNDFKAWSTRRLRERRDWAPAASVWATHCSTRYLKNERDVHAAYDYVINSQADSAQYESLTEPREPGA